MENTCGKLGVEVCYAFQELTDIPAQVPEGREKPWGTGQAVLACRDLLHEPFAVINADDYYGTEGFKKAAGFLETGGYALVGYILKNTLSENGGVTRGICSVDGGKLIGIDETKNIVKTASGAESEGRAIPVSSLVSMNFWCLPESFMEILRTGFPEFLANMKDPKKDEYLLPIIVDGLLKKGQEVSVLMADDRWFGMTYKDDVESVRESFKRLYDKGVYNGGDLYGDLVRA
ncbi:MAG: nucleotidyltransferase [Oscillospiraceae bacterium]|nr:nucleotidyltransferase [Oscillospiraceae bacterium]